MKRKIEVWERHEQRKGTILSRDLVCNKGDTAVTHHGLEVVGAALAGLADAEHELVNDASEDSSDERARPVYLHDRLSI